MKSDTLRSSSRLGTQRAEKYEPGATILQAVGVFFLSFCAAWRDRRVFLLVRFYVSCRASPLPPPPHAFPPPLLLLVLLNRECRMAVFSAWTSAASVGWQCSPPDLNRQLRDGSVPRRTLTASSGRRCSPQDLNRQLRMAEDMPERMSEDTQKMRQIECQKECQKSAKKNVRENVRRYARKTVRNNV